MIKIENFPVTNIFRPMQYTDYAMFYGQDLILLKSPMSGILFIKVVKNKNEGACNFEFSPIKTIAFS